MIIATGTRRAWIDQDGLGAAFVAERIIHKSVPGWPKEICARPSRAVVEILRFGGGLMPRALLGGIFQPSCAGELVVEVGATGKTVAGVPSCASQLSSSMVPGLPDEFARSVADGLVARPLPAGLIVVDRAAFDPVDSSPFAFILAAELLTAVLEAKSLDRNVKEAARAAIEAWP
ncbi:hypothetical protein [Arthrobacter bambusae]|uniref:hypothetical protein n=1 Tax=Arthrobacter bambusae TaxID=1338426 RepID=UPI0027870194|nr:hypothetical protein [Arthrobacter bambusae]MDQ0028783.1 hypothetical protein [Arthrobacter bambusae]MDQ0096423.1 hypothetical protein [Arthrobacter bambusae]